jgi:hypothetical protein
MVLVRPSKGLITPLCGLIRPLRALKGSSRALKCLPRPCKAFEGLIRPVHSCGPCGNFLILSAGKTRRLTAISIGSDGYLSSGCCRPRYQEKQFLLWSLCPHGLIRLSRALKGFQSVPERPRAFQSVPERPRASQNDPERPSWTRVYVRFPIAERPRASQSVPERPRAFQSVPERPDTAYSKWMLGGRRESGPYKAFKGPLRA